MSNTKPKTEEQAVMPAEVVAITPMGMLQIAVEQNADLDKLEKLMDLQMRWEANEARKAYTAALSAFKSEPPTIAKNKKAGFESRRTGGRTEYEYATLPRVVGAIAPALSKHGLSHNWSVAQGDSRIAVTCTLTHEKGHSESITLEAPTDDSGSKNAIQAIGSTVTYLQRYSLLSITGLAADDMDDDGNGTTETITEAEVLELETRCADVKANQAKFLTWLGVESFDLLPAKDLTKARDALEKKRLAK